MLEKILKLLDSPNIDDVLIGIELLKENAQIDPITQVFTTNNHTNFVKGKEDDEALWWCRNINVGFGQYYTPYKYGHLLTNINVLYYVANWAPEICEKYDYKPLEEYGK